RFSPSPCTNGKGIATRKLESSTSLLNSRLSESSTQPRAARDISTDTAISAATIARTAPPAIQRPIFHRDDTAILVPILRASIPSDIVFQFGRTARIGAFTRSAE